MQKKVVSNTVKNSENALFLLAFGEFLCSARPVPVLAYLTREH